MEYNDNFFDVVGSEIKPAIDCEAAINLGKCPMMLYSDPNFGQDLVILKRNIIPERRVGIKARCKVCNSIILFVEPS